MTTIELAEKVKETRDMQKAYFASGGPRYRCKKLLAASKELESQLDAAVNGILISSEVKAFDKPAIIASNAIWDTDSIDMDPYAP